MTRPPRRKGAVGWSKAERRAWARRMCAKMVGKRRAIHGLAHLRDIWFGGKDDDAKRRAAGQRARGPAPDHGDGGVTVRIGNDISDPADGVQS